MRTQDLSLEVGEAPGALAGTTRSLGAPAPSLALRAAGAQRSLAVVLLLQLALSAVVVVLMAVRSPINAHPDETLHLDAGRYFVDNWLPPPVGAPDSAASYSKYGRSYVDEGDIVYWMFGAAAALGERVLPMLFFYWRQCEVAPLRVPALFVTALVGMHALLSFVLIGLGALARHA